MATSTQPQRTKPIWKKWWFWVIVVVVVGGIGNALGLGDDDLSTSPPAFTPSPALASPLATTEATEGSEAAEDGPDLAEERTAKIEADLKASLSVEESFTEVCGVVSWACPITDLRVKPEGDASQLEVFVQESLDRESAERTALSVFNFVGADNAWLDWVIVYGADGVVAGQMQRSEVPLLTRNG